MGLTISSKIKNCSIELDGGYGMLLTIRHEVAKLFDKEFGEHYALIGTTYMTEEDWKRWDEKSIKILSNNRFKDEDGDIIDFLFMSDCEGHICYKTCKKIYDLLQKSKNKTCLRYAYYSKNDWEDLKELLLQCYKHKANLYWS